MTDTQYRIPDHIASTLVSPAAYADHRIHDAYRWLRGNIPLGYAEPEGYDPFWVVTRFSDIKEISRNNSLFLNDARPSMLVNKEAEAYTRAATGGRASPVRSLISTDAPDHIKLRLITHSWFAPKNLRSLEDSIHEIARRSIDHMFSLGKRCDFVPDVALHFPLRVIMRVLGVPPEDEALMLRLTQEIFTPSDQDSVRPGLEVTRATHEAEQVNAALAEMAVYFKRLTAARLKDPRDDIATVLSTATLHGEPLNDEDLIGYYGIIATAGHDTTSSSTAVAMRALAESPDLLARLKSDPSLIPALIEEAIRHATPIKTFMRTATNDTVVSGTPIAANDWMMLCYASANRDEAIFNDPYEFNIDRSNNRDQLAFGFGGHVCLGQHLARMEMRILFELLIPRLSTLSLNGTPVFSASYLANGLKRLPIKFTEV